MPEVMPHVAVRNQTVMVMVSPTAVMTDVLEVPQAAGNIAAVVQSVLLCQVVLLTNRAVHDSIDVPCLVAIIEPIMVAVCLRDAVASWRTVPRLIRRTQVRSTGTTVAGVTRSVPAGDPSPQAVELIGTHRFRHVFHRGTDVATAQVVAVTRVGRSQS